MFTCKIQHQTKDVVWLSRDALITAFATGSLFVVIAVLAEKGRTLLDRMEGEMDEAKAQVDVVVPTSFTLPSSGKLLTLSFLPFAGWLSGFALSTTHTEADVERVGAACRAVARRLTPFL